jgi:hypothetical protein
MKRVTFLFAAIAMLTIASCSSNSTQAPATTTADSVKVKAVDSVAVKAIDTVKKAK